ncbi:MAG: pyrroline-5-carboxylate reductase [Ruminococcaceae bacterium]|nr:pyrroline-5-carboxylate reductase [Oscillospiraceae bacterium]
MDNKTFSFIGCGNMGGALARAAAQRMDAADILLANRSACKAEELAAELGAKSCTVAEAAEKGRFIFLGVKPQSMRELAGHIVPILRNRSDRFVLVSMAAGISIERLRTLFNADYPVVRICPNTPVSIGRGLVAWCAQGVTPAEMDTLCAVMSGAGDWDEVGEKLMDVCTVVGGSTPAFAYMFIEALADGAVRCGMPRKKALFYAARAVEGAAALVNESGQHPGELKDAVCSPNGSTIVGVNVLEEHAFRAAAMDAVCAAVERTGNMGK